VIGQDKHRHRTLDAFFESIASTNMVSAALHLMRDYYGLTHVTYHLAQTVVGEVDAPFVRTTYPDRWVAQYLLKGYVAIDPIVRTGFGRSLAFDWSEVELAGRAILFRLPTGPTGAPFYRSTRSSPLRAGMF
jgi:hypothetical protein